MGSPHEPDWADFLRSRFGADLWIPQTTSTGALLVVRLGADSSQTYFAFAFGVTGRHLLRSGAWERGYGLRTTLNLLYPHGHDDGNSGRIVGLDAKRRGAETVRSRRQASRATAFETFELDRLRDVIGGATGRPADTEAWGRRISGGDPLHFASDLRFAEFGKLCRTIAEVHDRVDYRERFAWLDFIRPVTDLDLIARLQNAVVEIVTQGTGDLDLAPPEIVEWDRVAGFRFHFDGHSKVMHPNLRLEDYRKGLQRRSELEIVDGSFLRHHHICAIDQSGDVVHRWVVWRCLWGELDLEGTTYVLDDGEFFVVADDFLKELDGEIADLSEADIDLPMAGASMHEEVYNKRAARTLPGAILLDRQTISASASTTPVEVCDVLTKNRKLIHVKRHLGSRDLSHLFSQGYVSAVLMQEDEQFRIAVQQKIDQVVGNTAFQLFEGQRFVTSDFEVVYAIIVDWHGRGLEQALPFFSKVNLRRTVRDLRNRNFAVSCFRIPLDS